MRTLELSARQARRSDPITNHDESSEFKDLFVRYGSYGVADILQKARTSVFLVADALLRSRYRPAFLSSRLMFFSPAVPQKFLKKDRPENSRDKRKLARDKRKLALVFDLENRGNKNTYSTIS